MDPVTAVGLATNVAQLVEMSWKIVSKSREIHKNGTLPEHRDYQMITADLQNTNDRLLAFLKKSEISNNLSEDDIALQQLCKSSNRIANELISRLQQVIPGDERKAWKSLRHALKTVWLKSELDETAAQLQAYRIQLNTRILVSLREKLDLIDRKTDNIVMGIGENRVMSNTNHEIQTQYLTRHIISQHEKTRAMIADFISIYGPSPLSMSSEVSLSAYREEKQDPRITVFQAVGEKNMPRLRRILRGDPSCIFAFNSSGQTPLHIAAYMGDEDIAAYLLRSGARVNTDDNNGQTPLHYSAKSRCEGLVRALLAKGADSQAKDDKGRTPMDFCDPSSLIGWNLTYGISLSAQNGKGFTAIHHFCRQGDHEAVRNLLDHGADIEEICSQEHWAPLSSATEDDRYEVVRLLVSRGANVNTADRRKSTPLITAALHGYTRIGKFLLDNGADIEAQNQHKYTALTECCAHGRTELGLMLLQRGSQPSPRNDIGVAPIHFAARHGHLALVEAILDSGGDINIVNDNNAFTALAEACRYGHMEIVHLLIARGAPTEMLIGPNRKTALIRAVQSGHTNIAEYLLDQAGANIEALDNQNKTALYWAVMNNNKDLVQSLLQRHAKVDVRCSERYTPLCRACQQVNLDTTKLLIENGASVFSANFAMWTPLHEVTFRGNEALTEMLLKHGADPRCQNERGQTPLHFAARAKSVAITRMILESGLADTKTQQKDGWTALSEACQNGALKVVRILLDYGAEPNTCGYEGHTPLHRAAQSGYADVVRLLLADTRIEIDARSQAGLTPLAEASLHGHTDAVEALLERGASRDICDKEGNTPKTLARAKNHHSIVALLL